MVPFCSTGGTHPLGSYLSVLVKGFVYIHKVEQGVIATRFAITAQT